MVGFVVLSHGQLKTTGSPQCRASMPPLADICSFETKVVLQMFSRHLLRRLYIYTCLYTKTISMHSFFPCLHCTHSRWCYDIHSFPRHALTVLKLSLHPQTQTEIPPTESTNLNYICVRIHIYSLVMGEPTTDSFAQHLVLPVHTSPSSVPPHPSSHFYFFSWCRRTRGMLL